MDTVVSIFFFIYKVTTDQKIIKETRFNEKETKGKTYFKSHKKIKSDIRVKSFVCFCLFLFVFVFFCFCFLFFFF